MIGGGGLEHKVKFDFCHHVSWASIMQPIGLVKLNIPLVVGPVGGGERTPKELYEIFTKTEKIKEILRVGAIKLRYFDLSFWRVCQKALHIYVTTEDTLVLIPAKYREKASICQAITVDETEIDNSRYYNTENEFSIIMAGRLIYWKAFQIGLRAVKRVLDENYNIKLSVYGNGKCLNDLKQIASAYEGNEIMFMGNIEREKMLQQYRNADVLINCSLHDSGCLTVLEAMAMGVPVICVDTGGPKILTDDSCAIKIEPDYPDRVEDKIYHSIIDLITKREKCVLMGREAQKKVRNNFMASAKIHRIVNETSEILEE